MFIHSDIHRFTPLNIISGKKQCSLQTIKPKKSFFGNIGQRCGDHQRINN